MPFSTFPSDRARPTDEEVDRALDGTGPLWHSVLERLASSFAAHVRQWHAYTERTGWCLNVKDASGTLAYLYPERGGFVVVVTLGQGEVARARIQGMTAEVDLALAGARPFAKGWAVFVDVCGEADVDLVEALCRVKRPLGADPD